MIPIKTPEQIEGIRKSSQLAAKTLVYLEQFAIPGVSTEEINNKADEFIREHGAIPACLGYKGFPKSICTSLNEVICHGIPSPNAILKEGDILNIDVTTILDGYYGDTCKMYEIGEVSDKCKRLLRITKACLERGIAEVGPDKHFGNIGAAIAQHAESARYSVAYQFCGHGVGLEFHEQPQVYHVAKRNTGELMKPGMTFTIEPMLNEGVPEALILEDRWTAQTKDGKLSAQYEHTILVTETGYEILTI
jgi:methionyl aminopeptidase